MGKKILVVDDDLFIRDIYVDILKKAGYDVDSAVDGEEGLTKIKQGGFDLILLDFFMPKMNAEQVLDNLTTNNIPKGDIILLTNTGESAEIQNCLNKGASSYFIKTDLNPEQLVENVNKLLGDH